jgi:hypothetical protein
LSGGKSAGVEVRDMSAKSMYAAAVLALCVSGACGGGNETPNAAAATPAVAQTGKPKIDPCALLTEAEVESATGWKVSRSAISKMTGACEFFGPNDMLDVVTVSVVAAPNGVATSDDLAAWRKGQIGPKNEAGLVIQPVVDVGVPAIRNDFGTADFVVIEAWVQGGLMVDIGARNLGAAKAMVRAAVKRMP